MTLARRLADFRVPSRRNTQRLLGAIAFSIAFFAPLATALGQPPLRVDTSKEFEFDADSEDKSPTSAILGSETTVVDRRSAIAIEPSERPQPRVIDLPASPRELLAGPTQSELQEMSQWIRWLALMNLPPNLEDNRKWGKQRRVYDGVDIKLDGLRLDTKRKWKMVNQGTWSRYFIEFIDPAKQLEIAVQKLETQPNGRSFRTQVQIVAPLKLFGRVSQFHRDIQLMSISVQADATVALNLTIDVEIRINPLVFPPEVEFRPRATEAVVTLRKFEVHRISQIHGDVAEWIGQGIRKVLDRKLADYNDKLIEKINASIAKQQDKLKLSAQDWLKTSLSHP